MNGFNAVTMDTKGRIAIPARYRDELRGLSKGGLVITMDPQYPALLIYPGSGWGEIATRFEGLSGLDPRNRHFQWRILGSAVRVEFETNDRMLVLIPQELRRQARLDLKSKVALVGMGNKFELWRLGNWRLKQGNKPVKGEDVVTELPEAVQAIAF